MTARRYCISTCAAAPFLCNADCSWLFFSTLLLGYPGVKMLIFKLLFHTLALPWTHTRSGFIIWELNFLRTKKSLSPHKKTWVTVVLEQMKVMPLRSHEVEDSVYAFCVNAFGPQHRRRSKQNVSSDMTAMTGVFLGYGRRADVFGRLKWFSSTTKPQSIQLCSSQPVEYVHFASSFATFHPTAEWASEILVYCIIFCGLTLTLDGWSGIRRVLLIKAPFDK